MRRLQVLAVLGALALTVPGCARSSEDRSLSRGINETVAEQSAPKQADVGAEPAAPAAGSPEPAAGSPEPAAGSDEVDMNANQTVTIKGLASIEHAQAGGTFTAYEPKAPVPTPIKAGDRLRLRLEAPGDAWIYAIAAFQQAEYWKVSAWGPGTAANGDVRIPWPDGHILTKDDARMTTLFVIASSQELDWAQGLTREDCSALVGQMPPDPPKTACDHLYGLFWQVPKRVRGRVPPKVERLRQDGVNLPAIVTAHSGSPFVAVEWLFKPRQ